MAILASFVCDVYCPQIIDTNRIPELWCYLFCKHMADSLRFLPTSEAPNQHIIHVHVQARVCGRASIALVAGVLRSIAKWIMQRRQWGPGTAYN